MPGRLVFQRLKCYFKKMENRYSEQQKIELFKVLYPLFKQEVYNRRDQILKVASLTAGLFLFLVFMLSWVRASGINLKPYLFPMIVALLLFEGVIFYHLVQHKSRHEQAKRMLIRLEEQMGLFKEGIMEGSKEFYPEKWRVRGFDPGFVFYPLMHGGLILLAGWLMAC